VHRLLHPYDPPGGTATTDPDDIVAMLYEVGGRRDSNSSRLVRRNDLDDPYDGTGADGGPVSEASARSAYLARKEARTARRGGGAR
jgi:hypothetical protein